MLSRSVVLLSLILIPYLSIAQNIIELTLKSLEKEKTFPSSSFSFYAIDIITGKPIAQRAATNILIPASSQKVITTGAALGILGANYTFKTLLQYSGTIKDGVLKGNIYLTGFGDPTLGSDKMPDVPSLQEVLVNLSQSIKNKGIKKINGNIIGDDTLWDEPTLPSDWEPGDIGNYYTAGASALMLHENYYYVEFQQASRGLTAKITSISPEVPGLSIDSKVICRGSSDNAYINCQPFSNSAKIQGTIPVGKSKFSIKGSVPDPALFAAYQLKMAIINEGIDVSGEALSYRNMGKENSKRTTITTLSSPPLSKIIQRTNVESVNLYAEALTRAIGYKIKGKGDLLNGLAAIKEFWITRGISAEGWSMSDGSGLSRSNKISTKQLAEMMRKMYVDDKSFNSFYESLPIAGQTGSIKNMCKLTLAEGNLRAKSGSFDKVRSYTGFVKSKSGKMIAFSMIANNFTCTDFVMKTKFQKLMIAMAEYE